MSNNQIVMSIVVAYLVYLVWIWRHMGRVIRRRRILRRLQDGF